MFRSLCFTIIGPPDRPILTLSPNLKEGEATRFECSASDAYPGGRLIWYNNDVEIRSAGVNDTNPNGRYNITDSFDFTPRRNDNKHTITCEVRHETLDGPNYPRDSIEIDVKCEYTVSIREPTDEKCNWYIMGAYKPRKM